MYNEQIMCYTILLLCAKKYTFLRNVQIKLKIAYNLVNFNYKKSNNARFFFL